MGNWGREVKLAPELVRYQEGQMHEAGIKNAGLWPAPLLYICMFFGEFLIVKRTDPQFALPILSARQEKCLRKACTTSVFYSAVSRVPVYGSELKLSDVLLG